MFEQILHLLGWWNYGGWDTQRKWHVWKIYRVLMGKPEVQKPLESSRSKLENNIKSQLKSGLR